MTDTKHRPTPPSLSRMEQIDLREAWKTEARDFTPWLAKEINISLLGDTIGLDLEVEAQEREVGPFRADILCKDTASGHWVLVENQLERTDHNHLGQLLTYAAGLSAVTIVWVAKRFTDEHRAALDWLNEITSEEANFFGLEVELWRIGNSPLAPKFNVVCKPNDWTASRIQRGELTEKNILLIEFWTQFSEVLDKRGGLLRPKKAQPQNFMDHSVGRSNFWLSTIVSTNECRVELNLGTRDAKAHFDLLFQQKNQIEKDAGEELVWDELPDKKQSRIRLRKPFDDPLNNRAQWSVQHDWFWEKLQMFHRVFSQRVKQLRVDD